MRSNSTRLVAIIAVFCLSACEQVDQRENTVYLPEGDAAKGKETFVELGCIGCHNVVGADLPEAAEAGSRVLLGSQNRRSLSYGQLVTSIVNPSHRLSPRYRSDQVSADGQSLMTAYNDVMTVTQLTDLAAFLQQHYVKAQRSGYQYPVYDYKANEATEGDADE